MILVDSCVWIDLLRRRITPAVRRLQAIQADQTPEICINTIVFFEVLRGIISDLERRRVQKALNLLQQRDYSPDGFEKLVDLCVLAKRRGFHLPRLGDWLIVKTLLDHQLTLLTSDKDFRCLQSITPLSVIME